MSAPVLVYIEQEEGKIRKTSLEAVSYAFHLARPENNEVFAVLLGPYTGDPSFIGNYGAVKVLRAEHPFLAQKNAGIYAAALSIIVESFKAEKLILAKSSMSDSMAAKISIRTHAALLTNVVALPYNSTPLQVKRSIFGGKAFEHVTVKLSKTVWVLNKNACSIIINENIASVENLDDFQITANVTDAKTISTEKASGSILLTEAEIVVSGGRGLKGPENWGILEELASVLGAATACSKPVSDAQWRPHSEHVGQTGLKIAPNLYVAVGISGAIQHLAGVNSSRTIVVINKDPEAPFFKSADYGIIGDAFEVVPKLTEAIRKYK